MKTLILLCAAAATATAASSSVDPTRPMVTGRGNVNTVPAKTAVANQVQPPAADIADHAVLMENYIVTGSLLPHASAKASVRAAPSTSSRGKR